MAKDWYSWRFWRWFLRLGFLLMTRTLLRQNRPVGGGRRRHRQKCVPWLEWTPRNWISYADKQLGLFSGPWQIVIIRHGYLVAEWYGPSHDADHNI